MSVGTKACVAFCALNGVCAFFFAYCFKTEMSSMALTVAERGWNRDQKTHALRNAGVLYSVLAVILLLRALILDRRTATAQRLSLAARLHEYELLTGGTGESEPLLGKTEEGRMPRSGSYGSQAGRE